MRVYSPAADAAMLAGRAIVTGAVKFVGALGEVRVWGGHGALQLPSGPGGALETFKGVGDRGLVSVSGSALGGGAQSTALTLSAVDPDLLAILELQAIRGAPCLIWRLEFDADGVTLLGGHEAPEQRGRVERCRRTDKVGGEATLSIEVGTAARSSGRKTGRTRSDADQRRIRADDPGFRSTASAATKTLAWLGKPPNRAGAVLPGLYGGGGAGGGTFTDLTNTHPQLS